MTPFSLQVYTKYRRRHSCVDSIRNLTNNKIRLLTQHLPMTTCLRNDCIPMDAEQEGEKEQIVQCVHTIALCVPLTVLRKFSKFPIRFDFLRLF